MSTDTIQQNSLLHLRCVPTGSVTQAKLPIDRRVSIDVDQDLCSQEPEKAQHLVKGGVCGVLMPMIERNDMNWPTKIFVCPELHNQRVLRTVLVTDNRNMI